MTRRPVDDPGWDSDAEIVDEEFIERVPRRLEVRARLERECRILPVIAPLVPLAVPVPEEVPGDVVRPWRLRHRKIPGSPAIPAKLTARDGVVVGEFLRTLHRLPVADLGLDIAADPGLATTLTRMLHEVVPLLPGTARDAGNALLDRVARATPLVLAHGDLGPDHLLIENGAVSGIIDWTDACLRGPAIDLAWVLHGTPTGFADGVQRAYLPSAEVCARSLDWHRLGPWHEVLYGIDEAERDLVESGLAGVRARLS